MPQHAAACRSMPQHKKFFRGTALAWLQSSLCSVVLPPEELVYQPLWCRPASRVRCNGKRMASSCAEDEPVHPFLKKLGRLQRIPRRGMPLDYRCPFLNPEDCPFKHNLVVHGGCPIHASASFAERIRCVVLRWLKGGGEGGRGSGKPR